MYDVYASVQSTDLGTAEAAINKIVKDESAHLKVPNAIHVRGQIASMDGAFANLTVGLLFAAVFVYMLMVVNYQSFVDPLAVILALPGAGSGHPAAVVRHRHHALGAVADGGDHVRRCRLGKLHPAGHVCT